MKRPKREDREKDIAKAALAAFSEKGYRLTQVADVAQRAGVAAGTIYLFAKSKEELFWLALRMATGNPAGTEGCRELTAVELRKEFVPDGVSSKLRQYLYDGGSLPALETVVGDHFDALARQARAIKLIERCAESWPELAEAFYDGLRSSVIQDLAQYLRDAAKAGICRSTPHPDAAARIILETIAWFGMHRLGDPDGRHMTQEVAREATVDALVHAFRAEPDRPFKEEL